MPGVLGTDDLAEDDSDEDDEEPSAPSTKKASSKKKGSRQKYNRNQTAEEKVNNRLKKAYIIQMLIKLQNLRHEDKCDTRPNLPVAKLNRLPVGC